MAATTGKAGIGVTLKVSDGNVSPAYSTVANVTTLSAGGVTLNMIDATHLASPDFYQEFIPGLKAADEWTLTIQWDPSDASQNVLRTLLENRTLREFLIDTADIGLPTSIAADCYVSKLGNVEISPEAIMTQQCTLRPSGAPRPVAN